MLFEFQLCSKFMCLFCSTIHNYSNCYFFVYKKSVRLFFWFINYFIFMFSMVWIIFVISGKFLWPNYSSNSSFIQPQHSIIIYYCLYTIWFTCFSAYVKHIYLIYSTKDLRFFSSSFVSLYSFNSLFIETNFLWVIHESLKP